LLSYLYINTSTIATKDDFRQTTLAELRRLPVVLIKATDDNARSTHDQMVRLVEQVLEAKKQLEKAKTDKDKAYYEKKCASLDRQIDRLVYQLYGLSEKEIRVVEGQG
jgi:hypothetical protein